MATVKNPGSAAVTAPVSVSPGVYDVTLYVVAENDGRPTYEVLLDDRPLGRYQPEKTTAVTEEGDRFSYTWNNVEVLSDSAITIQATTDAESDDVAWGRWSRLEFSRLMEGVEASPALRTPKAGLFGELQQWHRVTLAFEGPASSERANPNPFLDYRLDVTFMHPASGKSYRVPGYFAADGFSAETGGSQAISGEHISVLMKKAFGTIRCLLEKETTSPCMPVMNTRKGFF